MAEEKKTYEDMSNPEKIDAKKRKIKKLWVNQKSCGMKDF